jgi:hypothetical protein
MYGYEDLIERDGINIVLYETVGSSEGDYLVLVKKGRKYGFVSIGYGSCSGCDAYEACYSDADFTELANDIIGEIRWFVSLKEAKSWITNEYDQKLQWYGNESGYSTFAREVAEYSAR